MDKALTIGLAAKMLGVSVDTLRRWDRTKKIPPLPRAHGTMKHRMYSISDLESYLRSIDLFAYAMRWSSSQSAFEPLNDYFCPDASIFNARLSAFGSQLSNVPALQEMSPLLIAIAGEIGNNSFDHNIGNWPDIAGVFFAYKIEQRSIVLADRGRGILQTLRQVKPELQSDAEALKTAFSEVLSGRAPENRGNGLKYVRSVVGSKNMRLHFQSGNAVLNLNSKKSDSLQIKISEKKIPGCIALINFDGRI